MNTSKSSDRRPVVFLIGTIVVGILIVVLAANLLRKPATVNPFDAPPTAAEPATSAP